MIYDAKGRPMRRTIGFLSRMEPEPRQYAPLVDALGYVIVAAEEYDAQEQCENAEAPRP